MYMNLVRSKMEYRSGDLFIPIYKYQTTRNDSKTVFKMCFNAKLNFEDLSYTDVCKHFKLLCLFGIL